MKLFYRISDNSYKKIKLIGATKEVCFKNFITTFQDVIFNKKDSMLIIADKCEDTTCQMLQKTNIPFERTDYGNSGSLMHAIEYCVKKLDNEELVYFCEDDYLHLPQSPQLLEEGIKRSDYITLYDHPDKYTSQYDGGEVSKVFRTASSHWRYTISTCMTFATKVKTLKEDIDIWEKFTRGPHPHDHYIFSELGKERNRKLALSIPGSACHIDLEYSSRVNYMLIDPWAIDLMTQEAQRKLSNKINGWIEQKKGFEKLVALDALLNSRFF